MPLRNVIAPDDPILNWRSFFRVSGRMSRRAHQQAVSSVTRWTFVAGFILTLLSALLGGWLRGMNGALTGLAAGIILGAILQAIPLIALQIQRLHDLGWSAKLLLAPFALTLAPIAALAWLATTHAPHLDTFMPWLAGCAFAGGAAYIALSWFLWAADAPAEENRFGPAPLDM